MFKSERGSDTFIPSFFILLFSALFAFFLFLQSDFINTGDAGELVSASYALGSAHPSGYPVYLMVSKLMMFLPFGNIAFKAVLVSSLFASLTAVFAGLAVFRFTKFLPASLFCSLSLAFSFSYFTQGVVAKFYHLNTFVVFALLYIGILAIEKYDKKYQYAIGFLLGISTGLHHSTFIIGLALLYLAVIHFRQFVRHLPLTVFLFFVGFLNNIYLFLRSIHPSLFNISPVRNWGEFVEVFTRKVYGSGSSAAAAKEVVNASGSMINVLNNLTGLYYKEFGTAALVLFVFGAVYLIRRRRHEGVYLLIAFVSFSVMLGLISLSMKTPDVKTLYIAAHQYFLAPFAIFAVFSGIGFYGLYSVIKNRTRVAPAVFLLFFIPVLYAAERVNDSDYSASTIANDRMEDVLFTVPVKSILLVSGDNDAFQGWYKKNIERFREDICIISFKEITDTSARITEGCNPHIYGLFYLLENSEGQLDIRRLKAYARQNRLYSAEPMNANKKMSEHLISTDDVLYQAVYPREYYFENEPLISARLSARRNIFENELRYEQCLHPETDDYFTKMLCRNYVGYLLHLAKDNEPEEGPETSFTLTYYNTEKKLSFKVGPENLEYIELAMQISSRNRVEDFYLK